MFWKSESFTFQLNSRLGDVADGLPSCILCRKLHALHEQGTQKQTRKFVSCVDFKH
jgi:hypothetical protein